jgi:hypothetical protein
MYLKSRGCTVGWGIAKKKGRAQEELDDDCVDGSGGREGGWAEEMKGV